ncbi:MAG: hypothetical protein Q7S06_02120 [Nanoarchaeota archaeon]|nr:hypothetical protein [Nanoarchaeota archaeon]
MTNLYEPRKNVYIIQRKGKVEKIVGEREDLPFMTGVARLTTQPTNSDIMDSIKELSEISGKIARKKSEVPYSG